MKQMMKFGLIVLLLVVLVTTGTAQGLGATKEVLNNPVPYGEAANFKITVTNNEGVPLWVTVDDPEAPLCDYSGATLLPGQTGSYYCNSNDGLTRSFRNTIDVTGTDGLGNTFKATAYADVIVQDCQPRFEVSIEPETQSVGYGGTASWTVTVKNTGTCPLNSVYVTDVNTAVAVDAGCSKKIGNLDVGKDSTYTCSQANVVADFTKVVAAYARDPKGNQGSTGDSASVKVIPCYPAISITGTPAGQFVHSGGTAKWKITVTNTGDTDLTGVSVSGSVCKKTIGTLKKDASSTYSCSKAGLKLGGFRGGNIYTYPLKAKGTACGKTVTANEALWVTVKPKV